jgi:hypothetical protein
MGMRIMDVLVSVDSMTDHHFVKRHLHNILGQVGSLTATLDERVAGADVAGECAVRIVLELLEVRRDLGKLWREGTGQQKGLL